MDLAFVGGAGNSGVRPVARLIGGLPGYAEVPGELGFHCRPRGLPDLLEGRITLTGFLGAMRDGWWEDGGEGGLARITTPERLEAALGRFEAAFGADPVGACRGLVIELLEPYALEAGKRGVVERSRGSLEGAPTLDRLFPASRFVHAVRDGREVALAGAASGGDGAALVRGIERWAEEIRAIDAGIRVQEEGATYGVWPDRVLVVAVCGLTEDGGRRRIADDLARFLDPGHAPEPMLGDDVELAVPERGAWAAGLRRLERRRVQRTYERTLGELADEGVHCAPELIRTLG